MKNSTRRQVGSGRPRYLDEAVTRKSTSKAHERRVARELGGRVLPASGATTWSRWNRQSAGGDLDCEQFHVEHKYTDCASLAVKTQWLKRTSEEAFARHRAPALVLSFTGESMAQLDVPEALKAPQDWMLLPMGVVQKLLSLIPSQALEEVLDDAETCP